MPTLLIVAGPNGAGKTTFANKLFEDEGLDWPYLNADDIGREEFPGLSGSTRDIAAGRRLLSRLEELTKAGESLALETTLSSLLYARRIPAWREQGYRVELVYIQLPDVEASIARVALRVARGGHGVPEADLRRRFDRSRRNLAVYQRLVDAWRVGQSRPEGVDIVARSPE